MRISDWSSDVCSSDLPRIAFAMAGKQARYVAAFGHVERDLVARQRPFGGKENRLDPAKIVVRHQARLNINGWKAASCCNVTRPWRASSSTATKLEARDRKSTRLNSSH